MKKRIIIHLIIFLSISGLVQAQEYKFGLGIRLSNAAPTLSNSITAKYFISEAQALEGMVSFGTRFGVGLLYEKFRPLGDEGFRWFYGAGGYIGFQGGDVYLGPAGTIGLDYRFPDVPLNISLDWKPELDIIPRVNLIPDAFGLSVRYTF